MAINTTTNTDPIIALRQDLDHELERLEGLRVTAYETYVKRLRAQIEADPDETVSSAAEKLKMRRNGLYQLFNRYDPTHERSTT
jgi:hypothetical protein